MSTSSFPHLPRMSRQLRCKDFLIVGDSNVHRNLLHTGLFYHQQTECGLARNTEELAEALRLIQSNNFKLVVFDMMTNLVVNAGNASASSSMSARLAAIDDCLKT